VLVDLREKLAPSIDPELMIRMLIVGYCYGIRFERKLCEAVKLHLGYRWFCRLELDDNIPDHSTFSVNRHGRFRDSDSLRQVFEAVVRACMGSASASKASDQDHVDKMLEDFRSGIERFCRPTLTRPRSFVDLWLGRFWPQRNKASD
jgi:hypothetical protein